MLLKDLYMILTFDPQIVNNYMVHQGKIRQEYDNFYEVYHRFGEEEVDEIIVQEESDTGFAEVIIELKNDEDCLNKIFD